MACSLKSAKYGLFISNTLYLACQIIRLLLAWYSISEMTSNTYFFYKPMVTALAISSSIIFITVVIGFSGIIRENFCCTVMFAVIMAIIFVAQTTGTITMWREQYESLREKGNFVADDLWNGPISHQSDLKKLLPHVVYVNTGTAVVELISLIFACCLANQIRIKKRLANQIINKI